MKYTVIVSVRGSVVLDIQAENINEAKRIAEEEVCNMDFNRLENIDLEVAGAWRDEA